jgi:twitching motility protein PilI
MKQDVHPIELLAEISAKAGSTLDKQQSKKDFNNLESNIGFRLCGEQMSSSAGNVVEIMNVPKFTLVPGAKQWVLGIANVRGTLLPIVDMEKYFGSNQSAGRRNQRVLVIEHNGYRVGLLVSQVLGLQHLNNDEFKSVKLSSDAAYAEFISATYEYEDSQWLLFDPSKLLSAEEFLDASVSGFAKSVTAA